MKGALIAMAIVLVVTGVLTGGLGISIQTSLGVVAAIFIIGAIISAIKGSQ